MHDFGLDKILLDSFRSISYICSFINITNLDSSPNCSGVLCTGSGNAQIEKA